VHRDDVRAAENMLRRLAVVPTRSPAALSREERLRKCASTLACTPEALDLLHTSLAKVLSQPHNERLRKVNVTTFKAQVANPAGIELLLLAGYEFMHGHAVLQHHDAASIGAAVSALSDARNLSTYIDAKAARETARAHEHALAQDAAAAAARRAAFLAKVPSEPKPGDDRESSACVITICVGGDATSRVTRRFDSDNTLTDLVHFVKSLPRTPEGGALTIKNTTTRPVRVLDPTTQGGMSLYALDLWPRGQVMVH